MRLVIDRSDWGRLRVTGPDATRFLQGLTTVNVEKVTDGHHSWGAILTPKGRVLSVIDIARAGDAYVVSSEAAIAAATRTLLERYAVMDEVTFTPIEGPAHQIWDGPASAWSAPIVDGAGEGARPDTDPEIELVRIRAGFLRYGVDVNEDHFPFETPLARFLDYGKGCYVGQEPVFRVHAQGNASHALRGLTVEGAAPIERGAKLEAPAKGEVTSSAVDGETTRALAYLHRSSWKPGASVSVAGRWATVHELPW
jgi:folate-binding protein YgfZ